jgi:hypothetical protein
LDIKVCYPPQEWGNMQPENDPAAKSELRIRNSGNEEKRGVQREDPSEMGLLLGSEALF